MNKFLVIAALFAAVKTEDAVAVVDVYVPCSNADTSTSAIILTAVQAQYDASILLKVTSVTDYETQL